MDSDDIPRRTRLDTEIVHQSKLWRSLEIDIEALCREAADHAFACASSGITLVKDDASVEVSIMLGDDAFVCDLNHRYRNMNSPTNVLAFSGIEGADVAASLEPEGSLLLGDIVLAFETIAGEAKAQNKPLEDHLRHMVVHGLLHLLGYDHQRAVETAAMEELERDVLAGLGVPDPWQLRESAGAPSARANVKGAPA